MYLPMYSPTRVLLRLKMNNKQIYKKEIDTSSYHKINCLNDAKNFISTNTKFTKDFDDYELDILEAEQTNSMSD